MLTTADKKWIRAMVRAEIRKVIEEIATSEQVGGYDGATEVKEDEWAEEGRKKRRVGFRAGTP